MKLRNKVLRTTKQGLASCRFQCSLHERGSCVERNNLGSSVIDSISVLEATWLPQCRLESSNACSIKKFHITGTVDETQFLGFGLAIEREMMTLTSTAMNGIRDWLAGRSLSLTGARPLL